MKIRMRNIKPIAGSVNPVKPIDTDLPPAEAPFATATELGSAGFRLGTAPPSTVYIRGPIEGYIYIYITILYLFSNCYWGGGGAVPKFYGYAGMLGVLSS